VDIVIADSTRTNLVQCVSMTTTHATTIVIQNKAQSYIEWTLEDDFIPLVIETYGNLHAHFDSFFISYVHVNIARHQQTSLVPLMFISYYKQWMSITLQHAQAIVMFLWIATLSHNSSSLPHKLVNAPPSLAKLW